MPLELVVGENKPRPEPEIGRRTVCGFPSGISCGCCFPLDVAVIVGSPGEGNWGFDFMIGDALHLALASNRAVDPSFAYTHDDVVSLDDRCSGASGITGLPEE